MPIKKPTTNKSKVKDIKAFIKQGGRKGAKEDFNKLLLRSAKPKE